MATVSIIGAPPVVWETTLTYPCNNESNTLNIGINGNPAVLTPNSQISGGSANRTFDHGSEGGAATGEEATVYREKPCARARVNAGASQGRGTAWMHPFWRPSHGLQAGWNAGARECYPGSLVGVFDWNFALSTNNAAIARQDSVGFSFQPSDNLRLGRIISGTRLGANPAGGFGCFFNDDGGGNWLPEWVVWNAAGATLTRIPFATPGAVPDYTRWSWLRMVIIGATGDRAGTVEASINGVELVPQQTFGVDIDGPNAMDPNSMQFGWAATAFFTAGAAARFLFHTMTVRTGRFLPEGTALQPD